MLKKAFLKCKHMLNLYKKQLNDMKDKILTIFALFILLYLTKTNYTNIFIFSKKLVCFYESMNFFIFLFFIFIAMCGFFGYTQVYMKQKTYLFLSFEISKIILPLIIFAEGYYFIVFFILYPFYKISDFFFTCLFKYLENLYYNALPKINLLLAIFVWYMLKSLEIMNKYQVLLKHFTISGFISFLLIYLFICVFLNKNNKIVFSTRIYFFCINFFLSLCVFVIFLREKTIFKFFFENLLEYFVTKNLEINKVLFFFLIFYFILKFFYNNKAFFYKEYYEKKSLKLKFYNFLNFILENLGYFFFNSFALGRALMQGVVEKTTEGVLDKNTLDILENAREAGMRIERTVDQEVPKDRHELLAYIGKFLFEIRKNPVLEKDVKINFSANIDKYPNYKTMLPPTYNETLSGIPYLFLNGQQSILLANSFPIWIPRTLAQGPDVWAPITNSFFQIKTVDSLRLSTINAYYEKYERHTNRDIFHLMYFFNSIKNKKEFMLAIKEHPERLRGTVFVDLNSVKKEIYNPQIAIDAENWIGKNKMKYLETNATQTAYLIQSMSRKILK